MTRAQSLRASSAVEPKTETGKEIIHAAHCSPSVPLPPSRLKNAAKDNNFIKLSAATNNSLLRAAAPP